MPTYPQTPLEFVQLAVEEAKRKGAVPRLVDPVPGLVEAGQWPQAREIVDQAVARTPDACGNLRTKLSWASQWAQGRLPGTMQTDLDNHQYGPEDIRDAWLEVISGGKYDPKQGASERDSEAEVVVRVDEPEEKGDNPNSGSQNLAEVQPGDDYADIQEAIDKGVL